MIVSSKNFKLKYFKNINVIFNSNHAPKILSFYVCKVPLFYFKTALKIIYKRSNHNLFIALKITLHNFFT